MLTREEFKKEVYRRETKKAKNFCPISRIKIGFEELEEEADEISHWSEHAIKEEKVSYLNETYLFCGTCWHTCWNRSFERKVLIVVLTTCYLSNCFSRSNIKVLLAYTYMYIYLAKLRYNARASKNEETVTHIQLASNCYLRPI